MAELLIEWGLKSVACLPALIVAGRSVARLIRGRRVKALARGGRGGQVRYRFQSHGRDYEIPVSVVAVAGDQVKIRAPGSAMTRWVHARDLRATKRGD